MEKANDTLKRGQSKKYRHSAIREAMLDLIIKSKNPLSYFGVQKMLVRKKLSVNKTTVYRELTFLKGQNIIKELQFNDGIAYYEIMPKQHHHHTVCNRCETIDHVELKKDLDAEEKSIFRKQRFKVLNHSLEFYGLCQKCQ